MTYSSYRSQHFCICFPQGCGNPSRTEPAPPPAAGVGLSCLLLYRWAPHLWQVQRLLLCHANQCLKWLRRLVFVKTGRRWRRRRRALGVQGEKEVIWGDQLHLPTSRQKNPLITVKVKRKIRAVQFVSVLFYEFKVLMVSYLGIMLKTVWRKGREREWADIRGPDWPPGATVSTGVPC